MNRKLMEELKWKKKISAMWKRGLTMREEYMNVGREHRDTTRKAKAHLKLNLAKEVKDYKKDFF